MFTGIVLDIGTISEVERNDLDMVVRIQTKALQSQLLALGDSIAVNGVCLTVTKIMADGFYIDVSAETLRCTTLHALQTGSRVNLETALTPSTALGGHWVSGHVDGVVQILKIEPEGRSIRYEFSLPDELTRYVAQKGSVTLDGVSLTVNSVDVKSFSVNIIPHTLEKTIFSNYGTGSKVNIEVDIIARYLERLTHSVITDKR